jgi:hypothetical protein
MANQATGVADFLNGYPTLAGSRWPDPPLAAGVTAEYCTPGAEPGTVDIRRAWDWQVDKDPIAMTKRLTTDYRSDDERWALPAVGQATKSLHPLLAWWTVLFTLSMLARYQPETWTEHLNVNSSPNAVVLETALDRALDTCPLLILRAIKTVGGDTR